MFGIVLFVMQNQSFIVVRRSLAKKGPKRLSDVKRRLGTNFFFFIAKCGQSISTCRQSSSAKRTWERISLIKGKLSQVNR